MNINALTLTLLTVLAGLISSHTAAQGPILAGRVIDPDGQAVDNADLSPFWRANGSPRHSDGRAYDLENKDDLREFWGHVGEMQPWHTLATTNCDGAFSIRMESKRDRHLLVMDRDRRLGAVCRLETKHPNGDVEIKLEPLVTVRAKVRTKGSEAVPSWSHVYVNLPEDANHPLARTRIVSCGSQTQDLEFRLPRGTYVLDVYAISGRNPDDIDLRVFPNPKLAVDGDRAVIDLGILELQPDMPDRQDLENEARESGRWRDYTEHYGEPSPNWHAVDSRGIPTDAKIEDLRGKWVLLEFWGMSCAPCLSEHIPTVMEFYRRYAECRDRFEVIGVCIDFTGQVNSMRDVDASLKPIIEKVWGGKQIPFPVVLDNTFKTWERFGIPGLGTAILVDPQGKIVEGGMESLEKVLDAGEPSDGTQPR